MQAVVVFVELIPGFSLDFCVISQPSITKEIIGNYSKPLQGLQLLQLITEPITLGVLIRKSAGVVPSATQHPKVSILGTRIG
jgi:hypothetical protein